MDSTQLRLILLVAGVFLILGIYAWERHKRRPASAARRDGRTRRRWPSPAPFWRRLRRRAEEGAWEDRADHDIEAAERREPTVDTSWVEDEVFEQPTRTPAREEPHVADAWEPETEYDSTAATMHGSTGPEPGPSEPPTVDDWLEAKARPIPVDESAVEPARPEPDKDTATAHGPTGPERAPSEPPTVDDWLEAKARPSPPEVQVREPAPEPRAVPEPAPEPEKPPAQAPESKPLPPVLVIHVAARVDRSMSGDLVMSVARDLALVPGDMDILHHHDEVTDRVIFSMASMVEPGTFPFSAMSDFSTPGLVLFAQIPGERPALETYDLMLAAADRLAALLEGRLLDERRRPLTREARRRMREDLGAGAAAE